MLPSSRSSSPPRDMRDRLISASRGRDRTPPAKCRSCTRAPQRQRSRSPALPPESKTPSGQISYHARAACGCAWSWWPPSCVAM